MGNRTQTLTVRSGTGPKASTLVELATSAKQIDKDDHNRRKTKPRPVDGRKKPCAGCIRWSGRNRAREFPPTFAIYLISNAEHWARCSLRYDIRLLSLSSFTLHIEVYYRLYTQGEPIKSNNPIYSNDPFISRIIPRSVPPPRTAASLKRHLCKIEGFSAPESCTLYLSLSDNVPADGGTRLSLQGDFGPGLSPSDPVALVVSPQESGQRFPASDETRALGEVGEQVQAHYGACSCFELKVVLIGVIQFITAFTTRTVR